MNKLSIDRKISRYRNQILPAEYEEAIYSIALTEHEDYIAILTKAYDLAKESSKYLEEAMKMQQPKVVQVERPNIETDYSENMIYRRIEWHGIQRDAADKRSRFYHCKLMYLIEKIALLKIQREFEQQPAA